MNVSVEKDKNYDEAQIQVLEGIEAVRKDRECILGQHRQEDCTILFMK